MSSYSESPDHTCQSPICKHHHDTTLSQFSDSQIIILLTVTDIKLGTMINVADKSWLSELLKLEGSK